MAGADLTSQLLELFRARAARRSPAEVLRQYERDRFVRPAAIAPARREEIEALAFGLLPEGFERLELSPLAPFGTTSVLGRVSQDWAVATARGTEVASDVTNVLALEAAVRRRSGTEVRLAASERVVRPQASPDPSRLAHFRLLGLCTAGRGERWRDWETRNAAEHIGYYLELLKHLGATDVAIRLGGGLELPDLRAARDDGERPYYAGGWFSIDAGGLNAVDGGLVDWTQRLLSNRKERLLISGTGIERLAAVAE